MVANRTWLNIKNDRNVESFEHPIYNSIISKDEFEEEFKPLLEMLDGTTMTDYIDMFYEKDIILESNFKFIGENEKMDFYEWAVELNCLPQLKEIQEGEDEKIKKVRKEREKQVNNKKAQDIQKQKQKSAPSVDKELFTLRSIKKCIEKFDKTNNTHKLNVAKNMFITKYEGYKKTNVKQEEFEKFISSNIFI